MLTISMQYFNATTSDFTKSGNSNNSYMSKMNMKQAHEDHRNAKKLDAAKINSNTTEESLWLRKFSLADERRTERRK